MFRINKTLTVHGMSSGSLKLEINDSVLKDGAIVETIIAMVEDLNPNAIA